ncbi:ESX secretion-associated protein EspG [Candidatus Mycolicibacterium alkanivorans]|uniref:ESX secretion-associated protein EspG n=1 Tax=Candidatus Mycolicibacterium alkanivorans TaxID=2954114 RepID=UPI00355721A5
MPDAVELTVESAWFIGDILGSGTFPWVLAITPPYRDGSDRADFVRRQTAELTRLGVITAGRIAPVVREWIHTVCHPERWLELRYAGSATSSRDLLRGIVARRGERTVVALRNAGLVAFSELHIDESRHLVPVVTAGLPGRPPARFDEFALPAAVGVRADRHLRDGAELSGVIDYLGIPDSARLFVESVFGGPRSYVEVVAGERHDTRQQTTEVGIAVVDTVAGRAVISPARAFDGEWVSTFAPGTPFAITLALEHLTMPLPDGRWFPSAHLARDFTTQGC